MTYDHGVSYRRTGKVQENAAAGAYGWQNSLRRVRVPRLVG